MGMKTSTIDVNPTEAIVVKNPDSFVTVMRSPHGEIRSRTGTWEATKIRAQTLNDKWGRSVMIYAQGQIDGLRAGALYATVSPKFEWKFAEGAKHG